MDLTHKFNGKELKLKCSSNPQFILKNKNGDFFFLSSCKNISKYNGMHLMKNWEMFKFIEDIRLKHIDAKEIYNNYNYIERRYLDKPCKEKFYFYENGLIYKVENYVGFTNIILDIRKIYDFSTEGRIYKIYSKDNLIIVEYIKYSDNSLSKEEYKLYVAISGVDEYEDTNKWIKQHYPFDERRNSYPVDSYLYDGLKIKIKGNSSIKISLGLSEKEVIEKIKKIKINENLEDYKFKEKINDDINFAYLSSQKSIRDFYVKLNKKYTQNKKDDNNNNNNNNNNCCINQNYDEGIYAGLPWFFQFWTRDEAISSKALYQLGFKKEVKKILLRQISNILEDGRISNRFPYSELGSADGIGWCFRRISEIINDFNKKEQNLIKNKLKESLNKIEMHYLKNNLIYNGAKETWMDTDYKIDTREGYRIEIQALILNMYDLMYKLSKEKKYLEKEKLIRNEVIKEFFNGKFLADGKNDYTIRPNIFIACYIYQKIFTKKEWEIIFDNSINQLWCEWGGLTTIDKNSDLFFSNYTGENNQSYHRGDSWFFVNHLSAISMNRINKKKFKKYIELIIKASTLDILSKGVISECSEISSASQQKAEGCLAQAWSSATFVELIQEIY